MNDRASPITCGYEQLFYLPGSLIPFSVIQYFLKYL